MMILGIETSCDETGASVVKDTHEILSNTVEFQDEIHGPFGGVVPEFAARHHAEKIGLIYESALRKAGITACEINGVAVANGPGLVGSLLVGFMFAKGVAAALGIPLIPVNHIHAHIFMPRMIFGDRIKYPHYSALISGGHTFIIRADGELEYSVKAKTRDDAAGEALDKIAHFLKLGYPGGKAIEDLAEKGDPRKIEFPRVKLKDGSNDFSYSGIKTAAFHILTAKTGEKPDVTDLAAAYQKAVFDIFFASLESLMKKEPLPQVVFGGGVAANSYLRRRAADFGHDTGTEVYFPPAAYCTDNAAMIAGLGSAMLEKGKTYKNEDVFSRADYRKLL